jgi:hypothetical protein
MPAMANAQSEQLTWAWAQHRVWSSAADRLKRHIDRARAGALLLGIATAVLAIAADQIGGLSVPAGRALSVVAAVTAGLATLLQRRISTEQVRTWTRARSVSEGLKSEICSYLAGGSAYLVADPAVRLGAETRRIVETVADLRRHALGIEPAGEPPPEIRDVGSYVAARVTQQIDQYYTPKASVYESRVRRLRVVGDVLGLIAVVLAALSAALSIDGLIAWVPVVTTIGTSVVAFVAASRYDQLVIEYLRTAQRLAHLHAEYRDHPEAGAAGFIDACEAAMSVENQGWMARWEQDKPLTG